MPISNFRSSQGGDGVLEDRATGGASRRKDLLSIYLLLRAAVHQFLMYERTDRTALTGSPGGSVDPQGA